jgi:anti-sigma B factor antagonist
MSDQLEVSQAEHHGTCSLVIRGELDIASAPQLEERLRSLLDAHQRIELDLSDVSFLDSSGLAVLIRAAEAAERDGASFAIAAVSGPAMRVLELSGMVARVHLSAERP